MDYTEAELEAIIFPSVDLDPRDWEEEDPLPPPPTDSYGKTGNQEKQ